MIEKFENFNLNEARQYTAVIKQDRYPDSDGRDILVGVTIGSNTTFLPAMNADDLIKLKNEIESYLKNVK